MKNIKLGHHDPFNYNPVKGGVKASGVGIKKLTGNDVVIQYDFKTPLFLANKVRCESDLVNYFNSNSLDVSYVKDWLLSQMLHFPLGENEWTLKELSMMIPEDIVIHCVTEDRDWVEWIHLCAANAWSAKSALNQTFDQLHKDVPGMDKICQGDRTKRILKMIVNSREPLERIAAISFRTESWLDYNPSLRIPRSDFDHTHPQLFVRFERQICMGFQAIGTDGIPGFVFLIKTYMLDVKEMGLEQLNDVIGIFEKNDPDIYSARFINENRLSVLHWLYSLKKGMENGS